MGTRRGYRAQKREFKGGINPYRNFKKICSKIGKEGFWIPRPIEGKIGGLGYEH
jgi:hypothetical protein